MHCQQLGAVLQTPTAILSTEPPSGKSWLRDVTG